jgi:hypothetical protein
VRATRDAHAQAHAWVAGRRRHPGVYRTADAKRIVIAELRAREAKLRVRVTQLERRTRAHAASEASHAHVVAQLASQVVTTQAHASELERCAAAAADDAAAVLRQALRARSEREERAEAAAAAATAAAVAAQRELEDATLCCVCMDAERDTKSFACGHLFCGPCGANRELARCPMCHACKLRKQQRMF